MRYIRRFYNRPQRAVALSLLVLLLGIILLGNFHNPTSHVSATNMAPPPIPPCAPPPAGMVSWYPLESGGQDIKGTNTGSVQGVGATFPGAPFAKVGNGFHSGGAGNIISVPDAANLNPSQLTIDAWVRIDALTALNMPIVWKGNSAGSDLSTPYSLLVNGTSVGANAGKLLFLITNGVSEQVVMSTVPLVVGSPTHVAASVNGSTVKLYINGVLNTSVAKTVTPTSSTFPLQIGGIGGGSNFFNGTIDELEIFNTAVADSDISAIYAADSTGKCKGTCATPPSGMVSWYPLESGGQDIKGANTGSVQGVGGTFPVAKVGNGFKSGGAGSIISVPDSPSLNPSPQLAIDAWVRVDALNASTMPIVWKGNSGGADLSTPYSLLVDNTGKLLLLITNGVSEQVVTSTATLSIGTFTHVAATVNGNITLYINGVADTTVAKTVTPTSSIFPLQIGGINGAANFFNGVIDELEIFNTAVAASDILSIFNAGSAGKCKCTPVPANLVRWYPFNGDVTDQQTGTSATILGSGHSFPAAKVSLGFKSGGAGSLVQASDANDLDVTQLTMDAWVRVDALNASTMPIVWKGNSGGADLTTPYALLVNGTSAGADAGKLLLLITNGAAEQILLSSSALPLGTFTHVAATVNGSTINLYINGALDTSAAKIVIPFNSAFPLQIGGINGAANFFNGVIDEFELFSRALTLAEIQSIVNAGSNGKCPINPVPPVVGTADLSIAKTDNVTTVNPGSLVTYSITVMNNGPNNVIGAIVNDTFPANLTSVSWVCTPSSGADCLGTFGSGNISNKLVNLNVGSSVVFMATGTVTSVPVTNTATVTAPFGINDPNLSNNSSTDTDTGGPIFNSVDLVLTPTFCGGLATQGKTASIGLRVKNNNGPATATGVMTTTALPSTVELCSTDPPLGGGCTSIINFLGQTIVKCDLQTLAPNAEKRVRINFRVRCNVTGPLVTSNTVWSNELELVPRNNSLGTSTAVAPQSIFNPNVCFLAPCTTPSGICPP